MSSTVISVPMSGRASTYRLTAAYFAAFVFLGLTTGSLGPTLPSLADQAQVGLSAISYVFTGRSAHPTVDWTGILDYRTTLCNRHHDQHVSDRIRRAGFHDTQSES